MGLQEIWRIPLRPYDQWRDFEVQIYNRRGCFQTILHPFGDIDKMEKNYKKQINTKDKTNQTERYFIWFFNRIEVFWQQTTFITWHTY